MNKDQIKGTIKDIAGKAQQKAGELTGSEKQQVKGVKKQVEGKVQKGVGNVKKAFDNAKDATKP
ncbi:MAG: CsbD family protein [Burkholderiales bacterium]